MAHIVYHHLCRFSESCRLFNRTYLHCVSQEVWNYCRNWQRPKQEYSFKTQYCAEHPPWLSLPFFCVVWNPQNNSYKVSDAEFQPYMSGYGYVRNILGHKTSMLKLHFRAPTCHFASYDQKSWSENSQKRGFFPPNRNLTRPEHKAPSHGVCKFTVNKKKKRKNNKNKSEEHQNSNWGREHDPQV